MKIQWTKPVEIEVVENIDEAEILETSKLCLDAVWQWKRRLWCFQKLV